MTRGTTSPADHDAAFNVQFSVPRGEARREHRWKIARAMRGVQAGRLADVEKRARVAMRRDYRTLNARPRAGWPPRRG